MDETEDAAPTQAAGIEDAGGASTDAGELARKGAIVLSLLVAAGALLVAFQAVTDAIETWLEPRWVPIWRAIFAVGVAALAVWVVRRLTR